MGLMRGAGEAFFAGARHRSAGSLGGFQAQRWERTVSRRMEARPGSADKKTPHRMMAFRVVSKHSIKSGGRSSALCSAQHKPPLLYSVGAGKVIAVKVCGVEQSAELHSDPSFL